MHAYNDTSRNTAPYKLPCYC